MANGVGAVGGDVVSNILQAAVENSKMKTQYDVAVVSKAKDVAEQQGQNALQLIQSASNIVDVRA